MRPIVCSVSSSQSDLLVIEIYSALHNHYKHQDILLKEEETLKAAPKAALVTYYITMTGESACFLRKQERNGGRESDYT